MFQKGEKDKGGGEAREGEAGGGEAGVRGYRKNRTSGGEVRKGGELKHVEEKERSL
jgi:hypothetical protein